MRTSRRAIRLPQRLLAALKYHSEHFNGHAYVFTREDGMQLNRDALRWRVGKVLRAYGLDIEDPYVMRHTFASIADDQGVDHQKIADMMGHRDKTTFERIYRHRLSPEITETADLMDGIRGDDA
jgi:integrase